MTAPPRRTKSELGLVEVLKVPKTRAATASDNGLLSQNGRGGCGGQRHLYAEAVPSFHVQEPPATSDGSAAENLVAGQPCHNTARHDRWMGEPHLHDMDISHQLRSMSQLSDPVEDDVSVMSSNPWNFHHRERSGIFESSGRTRYPRMKSSTGLNSTVIPSAWGRVRSPTAASSIYSRPTSAGPNAADVGAGEADKPLYTVPMDLNALFADWPLRPSASSDASTMKRTGREKPLPPAPSDARKDSGLDSFVTAQDKDDTAITWVSPPRDTSAAPRTSGSVISGSSKKSRFLERFSPPKRLVRKRRSIFKFLRPGSRKQQERSIGSPILSSKSPSAAYDGPSDDPALLTVQYELVERPQHATRSASMNQLDAARQSTSTSQLPSSPSLQRQPTLADYERNLSVMGDGRRRPSSMNLIRLNEIQEEDRRESIGIRRKLSRAKELKDDASPLMAQALTKHQREKDMFRSSSKRRETVEGAQRPTPVFSEPRFSTTGSSLAPTPEDQSDFVDPLENAGLARPAQQENSAVHLSPLDAAGLSRRGSSAVSTAAASITASSPQSNSCQPATAAPRQPKIGTSLASWSRYPSHTRFERCGSAGKADNVITRDFAFDFDPAGVNASDDSDAGSTGPQPGAKADSKQAKKLHKSRSLTFGSIMRYYSNLFHTSGFAGQNRRTSVTVGGRLERPELEMLPPQVPTERQHGHETLKHFKDIVKEDAEKIKEFVQEEENKIGDYVRKEEGRLQSFMREEESKLEKFVEEEEDKIEGFVRKEEGKLMKFVHDEEERWKFHQEQRQSTPFRHGSIFKVDDDHHPLRRDTMIAPNNDQDEDASEPPNGLHLDSTANTKKAELPASGPSKAQLWSDMYQQCIVRQPSKEPLRSESMPPPAPKPRIRRFPSVTVIDDQKGHYRSISLISVKTSRS